MSASQEKKNRIAARSDGSDKKRKALDEEEKKARDFRRNAIIAVAAIVIVVAAALVINSNIFYRSKNAVTVGGTRYSAAEVDVFYRNTFNALYSSYEAQFGEMVSYILDTSTPLSEQQYSEEQTWADYNYEQTLENMKQITALYDDAVKNGYSLSEEDAADIDSQIAMLSTYASMYGYGSADKYCAAYYGKGVNEKILRSVLEKTFVAQGWSKQLSDGYSYSQEELDAYYNEHADELDVISYYSYVVSADDAAFENLTDDGARKAAALETARGFADAGSPEDFAARVAEFSGSAITENHYAGASVSAYSAEGADWLLSDERVSGNTTVIESDTGASAFYFVGRDDNSYHLVSMRHILISPEASEDGSYTQEAWDAAETEINRINEEWQSDRTEEHFAELANQYSSDTGSNTNGGLYENITRYQMVPGIDDFLFHQDAEVGETALIRVESSNYAGWHLVYFAGENEKLYRDEQADAALRSEAYGSYLDGLTADYAVSEGSGARYVNK